LKDFNTKHGLSRTKLYHIYFGILNRCFNENDVNYNHYGGRGIAICDEWKNSIVNFYDWSTTNGYKDGLSIDRINNDGNYEPNNCRWTTQLEQIMNRSTTLFITINNVTKTLREWSISSGIKYVTLRDRHSRGWVGEKLLSPIQFHREKNTKVQNTHRKKHVLITIDGVSKTLSGWSLYSGIKRSTLDNRLIRGWSTNKLLSKVQIQKHS